MAAQGRLRFNVGGKIFETTTTTFSKANADPSLKAMLRDAKTAKQPGEHFIDADPDCFGVLLHLLQNDELQLPPHISVALLYRLADRYKLLDKLRSTKPAELDCGGSLKLKTSITGRTLLNESAVLMLASASKTTKSNQTLLNECAKIRASANGSCAVANDNVFHVYDQLFQELPTMNLDYMKIVGMEWYNSENILISAQKESSLQGGGGKIGVFHPQTRKLKHSFSLTDGKASTEAKIAPGNVAIGSDNKIFFCCKNGSYRKSDTIRVWDITTSHPTTSLEVQSVGNAFKLQWLPESKILMAVINNNEGSKINLSDLRVATPVGSYTMKSQRRVVDAVGIEEMNCVCLIDDKGRFGFVDMRRKAVDKRKEGGEQRWNFTEHEKEWFPRDEPKLFVRPKLGWLGGKLFRSVDGVISIYSKSGSNWQLASPALVQPRQDEGRLIHDFSIGGNRLFSLQAPPPSRYNIYDINVWETEGKNLNKTRENKGKGKLMK